jgi:hypothetical protein
MRNNIFLALIVLLMTAWAVAQQPGTTSPSAPAPGSSQQQATPPSEPGQPAAPSTPDQATPPAAPSTNRMPQGDGSDIIEGCLGGAAPNFTVTDKAGTSYKLDIPAGADTAVLTKHLGESVQVMGAVNDSGSKSSASKSIAVQKIGRGSSACSGAAGTAKPPTTK